MNQDAELLGDMQKLYGGLITENQASESISEDDRICINPFIGDAFFKPDEKALRIMGIGINAYRGLEDWNELKPECYPQWYENSKDASGRGLRFFTRTKNIMKFIGEEVAKNGYVFDRLKYDGISSHYFTNVVKIYLEKRAGKQAKHVQNEMITAHLEALPKELGILAKHNCFPHVIVLFWLTGEAAWQKLWNLFSIPEGQDQEITVIESVVSTKYTPCKGSEAVHHANRIEIMVGDKPQTLLILRVAHPSSRNSNWTAQKLVDHGEFIELITA